MNPKLSKIIGVKKLSDMRAQKTATARNKNLHTDAKHKPLRGMGATVICFLLPPPTNIRPNNFVSSIYWLHFPSFFQWFPST